MGYKKAFCKHINIKTKTKDRAGPLLREEEKLKTDATKKVKEFNEFLLQSSLRG